MILISFSSYFAQETRIDFAYKYMYAGQWDKMIKTYNFSRPDLINKQPLFINGMNTSITRIFSTEKKIKQGIRISYCYFRSQAVNTSLTNTLHLHLIDPGYILHFDSQKFSNKLYSEIIASANLGIITRSIDNEPMTYDEDGKLSKAFGLGASVEALAGYKLNMKDKFTISPFASISYTPFYYSPYTEAVINQTYGLVAKAWTGIISAKVGISIKL